MVWLLTGYIVEYIEKTRWFQEKTGGWDGGLIFPSPIIFPPPSNFHHFSQLHSDFDFIYTFFLMGGFLPSPIDFREYLLDAFTSLKIWGTYKNWSDYKWFSKIWGTSNNYGIYPERHSTNRLHNDSVNGGLSWGYVVCSSSPL